LLAAVKTLVATVAAPFTITLSLSAALLTIVPAAAAFSAAYRVL
jgi:hypothetical protein